MRINKQFLGTLLLVAGSSSFPFLSSFGLTENHSPVSAQTTQISLAQTIQPTTQESVLQSADKYISKQQALHLVHTKYFHFFESHAIHDDQLIPLSNLSDSYYYYLNYTTHTIGIAINPSAAKAITEQKQPVFIAQSGQTLSETLTHWAVQAGYRLKWLSQYDYRLQYSYEFVGDLTSSDGPINQILQSIANTNYSLKAEITKNKVILIKDNDFSPSVLSE